MISELGARFIRHGSVVMTHAYSRVVLEVFKQAVSQVCCTCLMCRLRCLSKFYKESSASREDSYYEGLQDDLKQSQYNVVIVM